MKKHIYKLFYIHIYIIMNIEDSSKLAEATYLMNVSGKNRNEKYEMMNDFVKDSGYKVVPKHTNKNITTYMNDKGQVHISHKGTNVKSKGGFKDVASDIGIALGLADYVPHITKRRRQTEKAIKQLDVKPNELSMSGHSLGGFSMNHTIATSKKVRKALRQADSFNAAQNPIFNNELKVSDKIKQDLDKKVKHHRIRGDLVSSGFKSNLPFGEIVKYKVKPEKGKKSKSIINKLLVNNPLINNIKNLSEKALHSHHIDHFNTGEAEKI